MLDLAKGDGIDLAQVVAKTQRADGDPLDHALGTADVDVLADAERIVDQEEDARDDVANERLGAKADGDPDDARAGEQRADVDAERGDDDHPDDGYQGDKEELAHQRQQCLQSRQPGPCPLAFNQRVRVDRLLGHVPAAGGLDNAQRAEARISVTMI